jgi:uncharacterized Fe-S radical SAM superfamily protein PflX
VTGFQPIAKEYRRKMTERVDDEKELETMKHRRKKTKASNRQLSAARSRIDRSEVGITHCALRADEVASGVAHVHLGTWNSLMPSAVIE